GSVHTAAAFRGRTSAECPVRAPIPRPACGAAAGTPGMAIRDGTIPDGTTPDGTTLDGTVPGGPPPTPSWCPSLGLACSSGADSDSATFRSATPTIPTTIRITPITRTTTGIRPLRRIHRPATIRPATRARRDPPLRPTPSMPHRRDPLLH